MMLSSKGTRVIALIGNCDITDILSIRVVALERPLLVISTADT